MVLDIVSVTTRTAQRPEIVVKTAKAGVKAIWAEKPISQSLREADEMIEACRAAGVKFAINCSRRSHPFYLKAKELIDAGRIGRLRSITAYSSGGLSHAGSHLLDSVRYFADGDVEWVFGHIDSDEDAQSDADIGGSGYLWFDNGVRAFINMSHPTGAGIEMDLVGEKGRIRIRGNVTAMEFWTLEGSTLVQRPFPLPQRIPSKTVVIVRDLVRCLEADRTPHCSGEDGRAALEIALALRESHRRGGVRVDLPLENRDLKMISS